MDTIIIGNGIVALTTAFRLACRANSNDGVVIIGKPSRPGSASLAAGAMLNSFAEIEADSLSSELDLFHFELSHLASRMWPDFEMELIVAAGSRLPAGCGKCEGVRGGGCFQHGTFVVNNTAADSLDDENFDAIMAALEAYDEPHRLVSPSDIPNYMPDQRYRATRAVYLPNEGWFNPRLMIEKLDNILRQHARVRYVEASAQSLLAEGGKISGVLLDDGAVISGDKYLLANGAAAWDFLQSSNLPVNMQRVFYGVGVSMEIRSPDYPHTHCIRTPNRGLACGIYSVPYFTGPDTSHDHILLGASNLMSPVPCNHGRIMSVESILKAGMEQINRNFYRAELVRVNVGWRPTSQDTFPLLGGTSIENLFIATGTKRDGFHLSPLISQYLVQMLYGEPTDPRLEWFAPERRPIVSLTREQAINKAVKHQISAAYQHGFAPAKSRMPEQIEQMYREQLERLHDQVGAVDWGIPPELLDMYRYGHAKTP